MKKLELIIEKNRLLDAASEPIKGAEYTEDLDKYLEHKLFVINGGHAWSGYLAQWSHILILHLDALQRLVSQMPSHVFPVLRSVSLH